VKVIVWKNLASGIGLAIQLGKEGGSNALFQFDGTVERGGFLVGEVTLAEKRGLPKG
jgi:hypothetical protein